MYVKTLLGGAVGGQQYSLQCGQQGHASLGLLCGAWRRGEGPAVPSRILYPVFRNTVLSYHSDFQRLQRGAARFQQCLVNLEIFV